MKSILVLLILALLAISGCSDSGQTQEAKITVEEEGLPARTIRIKVEDKKDVVIEDPYIAEIETLSAEYQKQRSRYIKENATMTSEERKAFGDLRDRTGEQVRKLQGERKAYIREKMKEHNGINFTIEVQN